MITRFYKIVDENNTPVYIGLTTREINNRFKEHIYQKKFDISKYHIKEIDFIKHPIINNIEIFYQEYSKVKEKEKYYIKYYREKYNLLNISSGGEWNTYLLKKIVKEDFFNKYGNCDNFNILYNNRTQYIKYLNRWLYHKTENKYKVYLSNWINTKNINDYQKYLKNWLKHIKDNNYQNYLYNWIVNNSKADYKKYLNKWILRRNENKYKYYLKNWIRNKTLNEYRKYLSSWKYHKSINNYKKYLFNWLAYNIKYPYRRYLSIWIYNRKAK